MDVDLINTVERIAMLVSSRRWDEADDALHELILTLKRRK